MGRLEGIEPSPADSQTAVLNHQTIASTKLSDEPQRSRTLSTAVPPSVCLSTITKPRLRQKAHLIRDRGCIFTPHIVIAHLIRCYHVAPPSQRTDTLASQRCRQVCYSKSKETLYLSGGVTGDQTPASGVQIQCALNNTLTPLRTWRTRWDSNP